MKHPALTRALAVSLVVVCLAMLLAGVFGLRATENERLRRQEEHGRLSARIEDYRAARSALHGQESYEQAKRIQEERQEEHEDVAAQHRMDLATYTATRSGIQQGTAALDEADAQFAAGKQQYLDGLAAFEQKEAEFYKGYEQFQAGKQQLAEAWEQFDLLSSAILQARAELAGLSAASEILIHEDTEDPELLRQLALAAYDEAIAAFDRAMGVSDGVRTQRGLSPQQMQALVAALAQQEGLSPEELLPEGISAEQLQQIEQAIVEATGMSPEEIRAALVAGRDQAAELGGEVELTPEQFAAVRELFRENSLLVQLAIGALSSRLEELSASLEPARAQLEATQAEIDKMEALMEQGKAGIEQGRQAIETAGLEIKRGEAALRESREQLWYQMGKLQEQEEELRQEKEQLDRQSEELQELDAQTQSQKEREQRERTLRLTLLERDEIARRVEAGESLLEAAEGSAADFAAETESLYRGRMRVNLLMLAGALCGCLGVPAAFEKTRKRLLLIGPVLLCFGCAAAAEALCLRLGRGSSYSAIAVMLFAFLQLLTLLPGKKPKAQ